MENGLSLFGLLIVVVAVYKLTQRRLSGPQATVRGLLRRYHSFERAGYPEQESLFNVLISRSGWRYLPPAFIAEIVARFRSKENVFRFVSLTEEYKFNRRQLPAIVVKNDMEGAMREIAVWLVDFGMRLQKENRLKEAEFVQKLALALQPKQFFTKLPLATTYYKMEKYRDAVPLFEAGLCELDECIDMPTALMEALPFPDELGPGSSLENLRITYKEIHAACLRAGGNQNVV